MCANRFEYDGELNPAFRAGPFVLPITAISAYLPEPLTPRLVHISSAGAPAAASAFQVSVVCAWFEEGRGPLHSQSPCAFHVCHGVI